MGGARKEIDNVPDCLAPMQGQIIRTEISCVQNVKWNVDASVKGDKKKWHIGHVHPSSQAWE